MVVGSRSAEASVLSWARLVLCLGADGKLESDGSGCPATPHLSHTVSLVRKDKGRSLWYFLCMEVPIA